MKSHLIRRLLEGVNPRALLLRDNRGPRWSRMDLFNPKMWSLVGYQSEIVLQADAASFVILLFHPTLDTEEMAEAQQLATLLSTSFNGSSIIKSGDLAVKFDTVVDFINALSSLGRSPQPSDL